MAGHRSAAAVAPAAIAWDTAQTTLAADWTMDMVEAATNTVTNTVRNRKGGLGSCRTTAIPTRRIGRDGPETGVLALGSWHTYDRMLFAETVALLRTAVDVGITLFDVGTTPMIELGCGYTDELPVATSTSRRRGHGVIGREHPAVVSGYRCRICS
jgi:hypothetical protein